MGDYQNPYSFIIPTDPIKNSTDTIKSSIDPIEIPMVISEAVIKFKKMCDEALWKHCQLIHGGEKQTFSMAVVGSFKSCLERQINEAVRITSSKANIVMNSKSEFHQAPIVRVVATNGLQMEQGEEQGWIAVRGRGGGGRPGRGQQRRRNAGD